jgi:hypothetical protein
VDEVVAIVRGAADWVLDLSTATAALPWPLLVLLVLPLALSLLARLLGATVLLLLLYPAVLAPLIIPVEPYQRWGLMLAGWSMLMGIAAFAINFRRHISAVKAAVRSVEARLLPLESEEQRAFLRTLRGTNEHPGHSKPL